MSGRLKPDGRWEIRVTLTRLDGAKKRKSCYGKTLAEAQREAFRLIHETGRIQLESLTVAELAGEWRKTWQLKPAKHGQIVIEEEPAV